MRRLRRRLHMARTCSGLLVSSRVADYGLSKAWPTSAQAGDYSFQCSCGRRFTARRLVKGAFLLRLTPDCAGRLWAPHSATIFNMPLPARKWAWIRFSEQGPSPPGWWRRSFAGRGTNRPRSLQHPHPRLAKPNIPSLMDRGTLKLSESANKGRPSRRSHGHDDVKSAPPRVLLSDVAGDGLYSGLGGADRLKNHRRKRAPRPG
jgi:hypothetical protein